MAKELRAVRGTKDILPEDHERFSRVIDKAGGVSGRYGFKPFSTPILEYTEVFSRTLGDASDIVNKEMYTFQDRGGDSVTLRPEFTAGIARAFITNGLAQRVPLKLFCAGPLFRYERPQKGRQREFHQINVESIGAAEPLADVEVICAGAAILRELGLGGRVKLELNSLGDKESRDNYRRALVDYLSKFKNGLSKDSQNRLGRNPLRILDSKDEADKRIVEGAPNLPAYYTDAAKTFFGRVQEGLEATEVSYELNPRLVRGLDYYCHTVFEFTTSELGAQNAVISGGRYDGLIHQMGGPQTPAVGWAGGVERLAAMVAPKGDACRPIALVPIGEAAERRAVALAERLRTEGRYVELGYGGKVAKRMKQAAKLGASRTVIFGEDEISRGVYKIKDMGSGEERSVDAGALSEALDGA